MVTGAGTAIQEIIPPYDKDRRPALPGVPEVGQIVQTVVPDIGAAWKIFDVVRADHSSHVRAEGTIRQVDCGSVGYKDYRPKAGRLPIFKLQLGDCEELLALRSKMRPCVVLAAASGIPDSALPVGVERNKGREAFLRAAYLVAPAFSVSSGREQRAFGPTIAARAECLVYPQFVFLPQSGGIIRNDSVVRLDRAFWTTLPPPTELEKLFLSPERLGLLHGQLLTLHGKDAGPEYVEMVELLRTALPPEYEAGL